MKTTRCPGCRAQLDFSRTIDERWSQPEGRGIWVYRVSCAHCLTIVRIERAEIDATGRAPRPSPSIDTDGSVVARVMERLRVAESAGDLASELERFSAEERVLLRIPEVLGIARRIYAGSMRLTRTQMFVHAPTSGLTALQGEIELRDPGEDRDVAPVADDRVATGFPDGVVLLPEGLLLEVLDTRAGRVRVAAASLRIEGLPMSFEDVDALLVFPDALAPAGESP